ncbi:hypothetical protein CBR_g940 [Chara braunii]|uniref:Uncharacterized protein n=1 Tax=Chara braunii TaxID=69332 RepID=A0A388KCQ2_CHABU|nr:hypothetical protein CBR_g940 [Chara braunii]|eukprot:GBG67819.1 hypothetical protein CBR_g940 [Chara braunii]
MEEKGGLKVTGYGGRGVVMKEEEGLVVVGYGGRVWVMEEEEGLEVVGYGGRVWVMKEEEGLEVVDYGGRVWVMEEEEGLEVVGYGGRVWVMEEEEGLEVVGYGGRVWVMEEGEGLGRSGYGGRVWVIEEGEGLGRSDYGRRVWVMKEQEGLEVVGYGGRVWVMNLTNQRGHGSGYSKTLNITQNSQNEAGTTTKGMIEAEIRCHWKRMKDAEKVVRPPRDETFVEFQSCGLDKYGQVELETALKFRWDSLPSVWHLRQARLLETSNTLLENIQVMETEEELADELWLSKSGRISPEGHGWSGSTMPAGSTDVEDRNVAEGEDENMEQLEGGSKRRTSEAKPSIDMDKLTATWQRVGGDSPEDAAALEKVADNRVFINCLDVEDINADITESNDQKVMMMNGLCQSRKDIFAVKWQLQKQDLQLEQLRQEIQELQLFRGTKEILQSLRTEQDIIRNTEAVRLEHQLHADQAIKVAWIEKSEKFVKERGVRIKRSMEENREFKQKLDQAEAALKECSRVASMRIPPALGENSPARQWARFLALMSCSELKDIIKTQKEELDEVRQKALALRRKSFPFIDQNQTTRRRPVSASVNKRRPMSAVPVYQRRPGTSPAAFSSRNRPVSAGA